MGNAPSRPVRAGWWHDAARLRGRILLLALGVTLVFAAAPLLPSFGLEAVSLLLRAPLYMLALAVILFAAGDALATVHRRHDKAPE